MDGGNMRNKNIYEKLQLARIELQELKLKKSGKNKFANFNYYELADFLPHINKIFGELKLFSKFDLLLEKATLTIIDIENEKSQITFESDKTEAILKGTTAIQQLGATHTYLKRYLYLNALEIVENDAVDANIGKDEKVPFKQGEKQVEKKEPTIKDIILYIQKYEKKYKDEIDRYLSDNTFLELNELDIVKAKELATIIKNKTKGVI